MAGASDQKLYIDISGCAFNVFLALETLAFSFYEARLKGAIWTQRGNCTWFYLKDKAYIPISPLVECGITLFAALGFANSAFSIIHLSQNVLMACFGVGCLALFIKFVSVLSICFVRWCIII